MHYTQRKRDKTSPHINLTNCNGTTSTILVGSTIHWLGVHFSCKLLYNYHVTKMAVKAENTVACISMLANTVQGLSYYYHLLLYHTCILPIITYASAAWWTGKQKHIQILNKVQNRTLHLICAAFHTTPTHALELEASIPLLSLYLDSLTKHTAICFNKLSTNNPILQRLSNNWYNRQSSSNPSPLPTKHNYRFKPTQLQKIATFTSLAHECIFFFLLPPWWKTQLDYGKCFTTHQSTIDKDKVVACHNSFVNQSQYHPEAPLTYSDGFQISFCNQFYRVGSAVVEYHQRREVFHWKLGLGGSAEFYDAELAGLVTGLSESISFVYKHPEVYYIQLYADNISAISIASNPKPWQGQLIAYIFYQKALRWLNSSPYHHLSISWSPGHTKIRGNEKADKLVKEAIKLQSQFNTTTTSASHQAHEYMLTKWKWIWRNQPQNRWYGPANHISPSL